MTNEFTLEKMNSIQLLLCLRLKINKYLSIKILTLIKPHECFMRILSKGDVYLLESLFEDSSLIRTISDGQYRKNIESAIFLGKLPILQWFYKIFKIMDKADIIEASVNDYFSLASCSNQLLIMQWFYEISIKLDQNMEFVDAFIFGAKNGNLDILNWIYEKDEYIYTEAVVPAVKYNQLEVVKWLYDHLKKLNMLLGITNYNILKIAVKWGHFSMLKWFYEKLGNNRQINQLADYAFKMAASWGNLEIIIWLCEIYANLPPVRVFRMHASNAAKKNGHLHIVEFLSKN